MHVCMCGSESRKGQVWFWWKSVASSTKCWLPNVQQQTADTPEGSKCPLKIKCLFRAGSGTNSAAVSASSLLVDTWFSETELCVAVGAVCTWRGFLQDVPAVEGSLLLLAQVGAVLQQPMGDPALTDAWKEAKHRITTGFAPIRERCAHFHSENGKRPLSSDLTRAVNLTFRCASFLWWQSVMFPDLLRGSVCLVWEDVSGDSQWK